MQSREGCRLKFYVASSFKNIDAVRYVSERLKNKGFIHTYDWTQNDRSSSIEQLMEIGKKEKNGVLEADFIVVLLPAGKGSHIELGIALGNGKRVYLYSPNDEINDLEKTSTFYHLTEINKCNGTIQELIETISRAQITGG
jgi:nucleoside 2-deoxyribosyltransferase